MLQLRIGLYAIQSMKEVDTEVEEFKRFKFSTKIFNLYDPHGLCRDHCVKVYYSWIHGECH